jgi:hypothetical protein
LRGHPYGGYAGELLQDHLGAERIVEEGKRRDAA